MFLLSHPELLGFESSNTAIQKEKAPYWVLSLFVAEREGFVLEFCKTSGRVNMICFAKFFGHRSKTTHCVVFSLRSNPIIFSCTNKEPTQSGGFFICGGERGIRTLGTVLAFTRFPIVRLRPAQPSLHNGVSSLDFYIISQKYKKSIPF